MLDQCGRGIGPHNPAAEPLLHAELAGLRPLADRVAEDAAEEHHRDLAGGADLGHQPLNDDVAAAEHGVEHGLIRCGAFARGALRRESVGRDRRLQHRLMPASRLEQRRQIHRRSAQEDLGWRRGQQRMRNPGQISLVRIPAQHARWIPQTGADRFHPIDPGVELVDAVVVVPCRAQDHRAVRGPVDAGIVPAARHLCRRPRSSSAEAARRSSAFSSGSPS